MDTATDIFAFAAVGVGLTLSVGTWLEVQLDIRRLIRIDFLMLWVLYGLTLFEFLFAQPGVDDFVSPETATSGTYAVLIGFAGIATGRHLLPIRQGSARIVSYADPGPAAIFALFVVVSLVGYLHILLAVNFDPFEMLRQMALPRFAQSWGRGRYGNAYSLLFELGMLIYVIPPAAGLVYARRKDFNIAQKLIVTAVFALTMWYGFAGGTRNVFATYLITFIGAYLIIKSRVKLSHVLLLGAASFLILLVASNYMLKFRSVGIENYSFTNSEFDEVYDEVYFDHNIVNVSRLTLVFPSEYQFLGFEIPYNALIRPIPRVLWPGKPKGLSVSIEQALGRASGSGTLSCTFVGEAYMAGGFIAVLIFGLMFGVGAELWNRVGQKVNSPFSQLIYIMGFVCAAIAMRSMLSMVPLMLPTLALWMYKEMWMSTKPPDRTLHAARKRRGAQDKIDRIGF
jgi:oligosaccharide repeat unit polymerase